MSEKYSECSNKKCKWVGTDEEKNKTPDKDFPSLAEVHVCPECRCDSFYPVEGDRLKKYLLSKETSIVPTDKEIDLVWENANFGSMERIDIVKMGVLKCASGYHQGHTSRQIITELGLITVNYNLTRRGRKCLWEWFNDGTNF